MTDKHIIQQRRQKWLDRTKEQPELHIQGADDEG